jgi:hypothetical protein
MCNVLDNVMKTWIYESPDKGKTVYRREFGKNERELYKEYHTTDGYYRAEGTEREGIRVLSETDGGVEEEDVLRAERD